MNGGCNLSIFFLPFSVVSQCPHSWPTFNRSCYKLFIQEKNWIKAKAICSTNNAQLVNIGSSEENNFIKGKLSTDRRDYWIGLTDSETEGTWKWTSGAILSGYNNWSGGQPNNHKGRQDCGVIMSGNQNAGKWNDISCSVKKQFICELN